MTQLGPTPTDILAPHCSTLFNTTMEATAIATLVVTLAEALTKLIPVVEKMKQNREFTPEEEAALDERIAGLNKLPWWKSRNSA